MFLFRIWIHFIPSFQESLCIGGAYDEAEHFVSINGERIATDGHLQSIAVLVASYLCFNLVHPRSQEPVLEAIEGLIGIT